MYILYIHEYMEDRLEELSNEHCFSDKPCETLDSEEGKNEMNDVLAKMMSWYDIKMIQFHSCLIQSMDTYMGVAITLESIE